MYIFCITKVRPQDEPSPGLECGPVRVSDPWLNESIKWVETKRHCYQLWRDTEHLVAPQVREKASSTDILNGRILSLFDEEGMPILRTLTANGLDYCGRLESHPYQLFLHLNDIEHTRTKIRSPQTNGCTEKLNQTIKNEFYPVAFRKGLYRSLGSTLLLSMALEMLIVPIEQRNLAIEVCFADVELFRRSLDWSFPGQHCNLFFHYMWVDQVH